MRAVLQHQAVLSARGGASVVVDRSGSRMRTWHIARSLRRRVVPPEFHASMTSVVEALSPTAEAGCRPATLKIGQLGLGNVGSALARLTRDAADTLQPHGFAPSTAIALVRSAARPRTAAAWVNRVTDDADDFFDEPIDVVVEAIGGVEPANTLVRRALDRGLPVVTANKSLVAAHGESLIALAHRRNTTFRYEASCIAGVPFLGTFERRPLVSRVSGLTAILNGTSNTILSAIARGASFESALEDAQRRGLAEPDPSADITGRDAAEKLSLLIRGFGKLLVAPAVLPVQGIASIDPIDMRATRVLGGTLKPVASASWSEGTLDAFVGPAFLPDTHPLAGVSGATNGILLDAIGGRQCFIGPGAGPDVTAVTLLDDVCEVASDRGARNRLPIPAAPARIRRTSETSWLFRLTASTPALETSELLGAYGVWCSQSTEVDGRIYFLTYPAPPDRIDAAAVAVHAATGIRPLALPALRGEELAC
jgi:homoserine dehydrogenase